MTRYFELLADFIESPQDAAPSLREDAPFGLGVLSFLISGLSLFLAQSLSRHFLLLPAGPVALILICLWRIAVVGFLMAGLLHLLCELSGGRGTAKGLFVFLGLSDLVWALALPAALLLRLAGLGHSALAVWAMLAALGFGNLWLRVWGLRKNYGLGPARAWALVCAPYIAFTGLIMAMISLAAVGIVASILHMFA